MSQPCEFCGLVHTTIIPNAVSELVEREFHQMCSCVAAQKVAMKGLLERIGQKTTCRGCPATIYMVRHSNGASAPYTEAGLNHFIDCPAREQFAKKS